MNHWRIHMEGEAIVDDESNVLYIVLQGGSLTAKKRALAIKVARILNEWEAAHETKKTE